MLASSLASSSPGDALAEAAVVFRTRGTGRGAEGSASMDVVAIAGSEVAT